MTIVEEVNEEIKEEKVEKVEKVETNDHNGQNFLNYSWRQNNHEVLIIVPVDESVGKKDITLEIKQTTIKIVVRDIFINGTLSKKIRPEESFSTIEHDRDNGRTLTIALSKFERGLWASLFENGPVVEQSKLIMEPTKLSEMDPEERSIAEKMLYEQKYGRKPVQNSEVIEQIKKANPHLFN